MSPGPLDGLLVIDLTRFVSGPYCTMLMADAGATVIKVEPPGGDPARRSPPIFHLPDGQVSSTFLRMNRGKQSIELDLKSGPGREALERLLERADVLVENFRFGVLAKLGFDEEALERINPGLVYASISGFGHTDSTHRDRPAFNLIAEYEAGVYHRGGDDVPGPLGPYVGDLFPGMHALSGVLMALYQRSVTGRGARVDIAMFDAMLSLNEAAGSIGTWMENEEEGKASNFYCPSGVFPSIDGYVCIDLVTDRQWRAFCSVIGHPSLSDDPRLATGPSRNRHYDAVLSAPLLGWLAQHSSEEAVTALTDQGVPAAVVRRPADALLSELSHERDMVLDVAMGQGPGMKVAASPIRVGSDQARGTARVVHAGADTETVLRDIAGMTDDEIRAATGG